MCIIHCSKKNVGQLDLRIVEFPFRIGTDLKCDLRLDGLAPNQLEIVRENEGLVLLNRSIEIPTFVNGKRTERYTIESDTTIQVGEWNIVVNHHVGLLKSLERSSIEQLAPFAEPTAVVSLGDDTPLISESDRVKKILKDLHAFAQSNLSILLTGATGVGKELFAKYVYTRSLRQNKPFYAMNCGCFTKELIESELFGYQRGAFSGAFQAKLGIFEEVDGGTLFLDEIGELPFELQTKLLRVLENSEVKRIGSNEVKKIDVRIIAATNIDLQAKVDRGEFRADLFHRLNQFHAHIPELKKRIGDIAVLAKYFLSREVRIRATAVVGFNDDALLFLEAYDWPGNVRELKHAISRAVISSRGSHLKVADFRFLKLVKDQETRGDELSSSGFPRTLKQIEKEAICSTLAKFRGNKKKSAETLGLGLSTLYSKIVAYDIQI
jgi:transcriptional regulator with PAS, ATPase and Fis domain